MASGRCAEGASTDLVVRDRALRAAGEQLRVVAQDDAGCQLKLKVTAERHRAARGPQLGLFERMYDYDVGMDTKWRRIAQAQLTGIAAGLCGGFNRDSGFTRDVALADIAAITTDPDLLAEAAAFYAGSTLRWHPAAVQLFIDAGADLEAIERHAMADRADRRRGFSLSALADGIQAAATPTPPHRLE